ncbi:MAG: hypothetical protein ACK4NE_08235, partial [Albidovulum sp.]
GIPDGHAHVDFRFGLAGGVLRPIMAAGVAGRIGAGRRARGSGRTTSRNWYRARLRLLTKGLGGTLIRRVFARHQLL